MNPSDADNRVIVVVEDDPLVRVHAAMMFEEMGFAVRPCDSAEDALSNIETSPSSIYGLFTDVSLAGEASGLRLARQVFSRWPSIRILVASGRTLPQEEDLPPTARFIAKPWVAEDVLAAFGSDTGGDGRDGKVQAAGKS
jgi:ActR/RegA family two-component response regulator